jgi:hypothetical protein
MLVAASGQLIDVSDSEAPDVAVREFDDLAALWVRLRIVRETLAFSISPRDSDATATRASASSGDSAHPPTAPRPAGTRDPALSGP